MTEAEIKAMQDENAKLKEENLSFKKENEDYKTGNEKLVQDFKDQVATIAKMKDEARERGMQFKNLRDMSEAEKELLTEKEKEIMERQEAHEENMKKLEEAQNKFKQAQRDSLIDSLAMKKAGGNKELADKIKISLGKLKDVDDLATEQELTPHLDFAFNGLGIQNKPDPLYDANNTGGQNADYQTEGSFAETSEGKGIAGALGLSQA